MDGPMLILAGLGNPGSKYEKNRHNVGFMAADEIARRWKFGPEKANFLSLVSTGIVETPQGGVRAMIVKPQTFMNESGQAVGQVMRFYKLTPADVVVFYDELDLAPGRFRMKTGGGAAGHNGIRSIAAHIGPGFRRARIGIGHPGDKDRVLGYVLDNFSKAEQQAWVEPLCLAPAEKADPRKRARGEA
jgi:PTH1 family peptidyl-tRNA hydrolase